jgi:hypothetical protein
MKPSKATLFWGITFLLFCLAYPLFSSAQSDDPCKREGFQQAWDSGSDPVYTDATELARTLVARGFVVECIRPSKEQAMVKNQKGGAWFKTNQGIFDVWFLPKGQNFDALAVSEQQQPNGRYVESLQGGQVSVRTMDSSRQNWFIKYNNVLFHVWGDRQLAESLQKAFPKP